MVSHRASLRANGDFLRLWIGQTMSMFGSRIGVLALPLTGVLTLHVSAIQMGVLAGAGTVPIALLGLPAGAWVDRLPRRSVMIAADCGRAVVLATVPIAYAFGVLSFLQLVSVALGAGLLGTFFDAAYGAFVPVLVPAESLIAANSALQGSEAVAQIGGPSLAGALAGLFGAPIAVAVDAVSYVASAGSLGSMRVQESPSRRDESRGLRRDVVEGLRVVFGDPILRALTLTSAAFNLFDSLLMAIYILYITRSLHIAAFGTGLVFGLGGIGGLFGAFIATRASTRFGMGRVLMSAVVLAAIAEIGIALAAGPPATATTILVSMEICVELGATIYSVTAASIRQATVPSRVLGRAGATVRSLTLGVTPIGGLLGGVLASTIGLRGTVAVAGVGTLLAAGWIVISPVRQMRTLSE